MSEVEKNTYVPDLSRVLFGTASRLPILRAIGKCAAEEPPIRFSVQDILRATTEENVTANLHTTQRIISALESLELVKTVERRKFPVGQKVYEPTPNYFWPAINDMTAAAETHFSKIDPQS